MTARPQAVPMNMSAHAFDAAAPADQALRSAARTNLYLAATLIGATVRMGVTVRNLSATGALVRSQAPIEAEGAVQLLRGSQSVNGTLVWIEGRNAGLRFDAPIDLAQWAPGATAGQCDVDRMVALSRGQVAPLSRPRRADLSTEERRSHVIARIAEEIGFAARRLETLGSLMADDPAVVARHPAPMQDLEIVSQVLGHLNRLLACDAPEERVTTVGMADLRRRLEAVSA